MSQIVIGPGTGLGVSALVPHAAGWVAIEGEGGHRDLAAATEEEWQLLCALRRRLGHVSADQILSGGGLARIHRAHCELAEQAVEEISTQEVVARSLDGDPLARRTTRAFSHMLGRVVGDTALTLGAVGGIYLGGGVIARMQTAFAVDGFVEGLLDKGQMRSYLEAIPVRLILDPIAALRGAAEWSAARLSDEE